MSVEKYTITLNNSFCSYGRVIAKRLGEILGIPCYNDELAKMAAERLGLSEEEVHHAEEWVKPQRSSSSLLSLASSMNKTNQLHEKIFDTEAEIIRELYEKESCIIVGRGSDYILYDDLDVMFYHIYAPINARIKICMEEYGLGWEEALSKVKRNDEGRMAYQVYFTGFSPDEAIHKDLLIDSSIWGIEKTALILAEATKQRFFAD